MIIFLIPLITSCLIEETTNRGSFIHTIPIAETGPIESKLPEGINILQYCICQEGNNLTDQPNCQKFCETNNSPEIKVFIKVGLGGETEKKFKNLHHFCYQEIDNKLPNCNGIIRETNTPKITKIEEDQMEILESEDGNNLVFTFDNENFPKSFHFFIEESNSGIKSNEMLLSILTSDGVVSNTVNVYQYQCIERFVHFEKETSKYFYSFPQIDYFQFSDLNKKPYVKTNENNRLIICQNNDDATFINDPNQVNILKLKIDDSSDQKRINEKTLVGGQLLNSNDKDFKKNNNVYSIENKMVDIYNKLLPDHTWKKNPPQIFKMLNAATNPLPKLLFSDSSNLSTIKYYQNSPIGIYIRAQKLKANINDYTYGCPSKKDFHKNDRPTTMMNKVLAKILGGEIDYNKKLVTKVHLETTPFYVACAKGESNYDSTNMLKGKFEISQPARIIFIPESDLLTILVKNGSPIKTIELLREHLSTNEDLQFPISEDKPLNNFPTNPKHFEKDGKRLFKIVPPVFLSIGNGLDMDCENKEAEDIMLDPSASIIEEFPNQIVGCMVRKVSP